MVRFFWVILDTLAVIAFTIGGMLERSKLLYIVFIPLIALLIPVFIYLAEKQRKKEPVDFSW